MLTDLERRNLKVAVGMAIKLAGGQVNAANVSGRIDRPATFSDYANTTMMDRAMPVDVAVEVDQFNGKPLILAKMAGMLGFKLVSLPGRQLSASPMGALHRSIKEAGEAIAAIIEVEGYGGKPKPDARQNGIQQIDEAVEALLEAKERLLRMGDE
jgi:hypothetical protein